MMGLIQPKPYMDNFKVRRIAKGVERRRNMSKIILEKGTPFPKPITYEDIDQEFFNWVDKKLDISYDGTRLPTYRLFSNQKMSEYSQTWSNLDDTGNIVMNFKTITRDNNPQHGESQGSSYNIPGNRDYPMFYVPVLQENGQEAYDVYAMKQPFAINFTYIITVITNKYEVINKFNEMVNSEFSSLECYIAPNGHAMPMFLDSVNDESEYTIDDRKYYSQSFNIKLMGYIIRKEDMTVTRVPSRFVVRFLDTDDRNNDMKGKTEKKKNAFQVRDSELDLDTNYRDSSFDLKPLNQCDVPIMTEAKIDRPHVVIREEDELDFSCCYQDDGGNYYNKRIYIEVNIDSCDSASTFTLDTDFILSSIETHNVYDFKIFCNGEYVDFDFIDGDAKFYNGDEITVKITREDLFSDSTITFVGYDPNVVFEKGNNPESELDTEPDEELIVIEKKEHECDCE